ncbi:MAG: type II secretion system protein [Clostridia bacterium]|nr:type II secretion system protein [Clostridia bacterium]
MKNNKGITLIALVITIIVLLILAGIAISMLAGDNGILRQAAKAKTRTELAAIEEAIKIALLTARTNEDGTFNNAIFEEELDKAKLNWSKDETTGNYTIEENGEKYIVSANGNYEKVKTIAELKVSGTPVTENTTLTDANGDSIIIPKNFKIASTSPTVVTEGMYIEDSIGNQYVWIPVMEKSDKYSWGVDYTDVKTKTEDTQEYYTAIQTALKTYTANYKDDKYKDMWFGDSSTAKHGYFEESDTNKEKLIYYTNGNMSKEEYENLYHNMLKSVYKNGGFYIGRYEMGIKIVKNVTEAQTYTRTKASQEYVTTDDNIASEAPTIDGMVAPLSKANAIPYNWITQSQAQMLAEKVKADRSEEYSDVSSSLLFGVQWDMVCVFIEKCDKNPQKIILSNQEEWLTKTNYTLLWGNTKLAIFKMDQGFYTTNAHNDNVTWNNKSDAAKGTYKAWLCTTGASEQNKSLNIYDLSGNEREWTLERFSTYYPCVGRGEHFNDTSNYASGRFSGYSYPCTYVTSARISLFM